MIGIYDTCCVYTSLLVSDLENLEHLMFVAQSVQTKYIYAPGEQDNSS
jgi:hypothetical protein